MWRREGEIMPQVNLDNALQEGREAVLRHAWREAYERLQAADQAGPLDADDLEGLAEAAWWNGRSDECLGARERAYTLHLESGRPRRAALVATSLAKEQFVRNASAIGQAWLNRAQRLLQDEPVGVEHGYLTRLRAMLAVEGEDGLDRALELARETVEIGSRFGSRDLMALGLQDQGRALIAKGQLKEGMALLDEATVAALAGELAPYTTGVIYCNVIDQCQEMADYGRAREWTEAASRWCDRMAIAGFPGMCRVHRADVIGLRGGWREAELEARNAFDELRNFNAAYAAEAQYVIGVTRLWRGDLAEAREAFRHAHELGRDPNPGLALLQLTEGKVEAAATTIRRSLSTRRQPLGRARMLPAQLAIALAADDRATAEAVARELSETAKIYPTPALRAQALTAEGVASLIAGDSEAAVRHLCEVPTLWRQVEAPYEEAKARVALASAYRAGGDPDGAVLELQAARATFSRLGAALNERQAVGLLVELGAAPGADEAASPPATRTFVFTDIVKSTELVEAMGDDAWNEVLHWHDQMLQRLIGQHAGEEIKHVGDGMFASFERPEQAIGCAVQIQRTLAEHRRDHGFAPQVRIGVHRAPASRVGLDYRGKGVHQAARIAAVAAGGEILASWQTAQPCKFPVSEPREVSLRGIAHPMQVVDISWR
jgi:class 3 adenylate cyclase